MERVNLGDLSQYKSIDDLHKKWDKHNTGRWYTDVLIEYASLSDVNTIIEFGLFQGMSAVAFLTTNIKKLYSVDATLQYSSKDEINIIKNLSIPEWEIIIQSSLIPLNIEADLIFLDTKHTYQQVSQELDIHCNIANKYIIIHDTNFPVKNSLKVKHAVFDFLKDNKNKVWELDYYDSRRTGIMVLKNIGE